MQDAKIPRDLLLGATFLDEVATVESCHGVIPRTRAMQDWCSAMRTCKRKTARDFSIVKCCLTFLAANAKCVSV
jgi:hypothetical protein